MNGFIYVSGLIMWALSVWAFLILASRLRDLTKAIHKASRKTPEIIALVKPSLKK